MRVIGAWHFITTELVFFAYAYLLSSLVTSDVEVGAWAGCLLSVGIQVILGHFVDVSHSVLNGGGFRPSDWVTVIRHRSILPVIWWVRLALQRFYLACHSYLYYLACRMHIYLTVDECTLGGLCFLQWSNACNDALCNNISLWAIELVINLHHMQTKLRISFWCLIAH